jgi:hypothetical protein
MVLWRGLEGVYAALRRSPISPIERLGQPLGGQRFDQAQGLGGRTHRDVLQHDQNE